jgi:superfamily I DNA/RNA helicase
MWLERRRYRDKFVAPVSTDGHDLVSRITHIIVDAQDIKPIFYDFISMLVTTVSSITDRKPSLLVGDAMQEVNRWNGSMRDF